MDDLKVLHMHTELVRNILKLIELKFEGKLEITIVKNHVYLGMDITFIDEGAVDISEWRNKLERKFKHLVRT